MNSSVENLSPTRVKLTVEIPFGDMTDSLTSAYKRVATQVNIPGFRRGKVPSAIIDQRVGRGVVIEEAINEVLPGVYDQAVQEHKLVTVSQPEVEITEIADGDKVVFTATVDIRPEFDLPDYEGIAVSVDDTDVTDEQVEEQLTELRKRFGTAVPVERAAEDGDVVLLDVEGKLDGERLEEFSATAFSYEVGSAGMVSGADEAIRGKAEGETATFDFTPEEGEFEGKTINLTVDVKGVRERSLPDADDEFAQLASEFDTLDELRADLRTKVERMALVEQGMAAREKVLDHLLEVTEVEVPDSLVQSQLDEHFQDGHGDDEHRGEVEENARKSVKTQFILDRIADAEELEVGQAELSQWLVSQAPRYGMTPDQFAEALVQAGQVQMAVADVRRGKALAFVLQKAAVTDASGNEVNLAALDEAIEEEIEAELEEEAYEEALEEALEEAEEIAEIEAIAEVIEEAIEEAEAEAADQGDAAEGSK